MIYRHLFNGGAIQPESAKDCDQLTPRCDVLCIMIMYCIAIVFIITLHVLKWD